MNIQTATPDDFGNWIELAREVEPLFGPMADQAPFRRALEQALSAGQGCCIRPDDAASGGGVCGGIIVSTEHNRIDWFAVARQWRGRGFGKALLKHAMDRLDKHRDIVVQTFAPGTAEGEAARWLYLMSGFRDHAPAEPTPAGVETVLMIRFAHET